MSPAIKNSPPLTIPGIWR